LPLVIVGALRIAVLRFSSVVTVGSLYGLLFRQHTIIGCRDFAVVARSAAVYGSVLRLIPGLCAGAAFVLLALRVLGGRVPSVLDFAAHLLEPIPVLGIVGGLLGLGEELSALRTFGERHQFSE